MPIVTVKPLTLWVVGTVLLTEGLFKQIQLRIFGLRGKIQQRVLGRIVLKTMVQSRQGRADKEKFLAPLGRELLISQTLREESLTEIST